MSPAKADQWRITPGEAVDLAAIDTEGAGPPDTKEEAAAELDDLAARLGELQERLWAERRRSLLVVLQALDAGGKDGTIKHLFRCVNPVGARVTSFRGPTEEELAHDFLWRIHRRTPARGELVVFNRSHYEDVVAVRVRRLAPEDVWRPRYRAIREFERTLTEAGTVGQAVPPHHQGGAGRAAPGPAGGPHQALEVPRRGPRRPCPVGPAPGRLPGGHHRVVHRPGALVRGARRSQVVQKLGGEPDPDRHPRGPGPAVSAGRGARRGGGGLDGC